MSGQGAARIQITSNPVELPGVRDFFRDWTAAHGWPEDQIADIVLAVDEALSNVIRHGYDGRPGEEIEINVKAIRDDELGEGLEIRIRDFGKQVPLDKICGRDLDDLRPGGLGVHIIRSVMEHAEYAHAPDGGMTLLMRKFRQSDSGAVQQQPEES